MAINLLITCRIYLLAEGLKRMLEEDPDINIVGTDCGNPSSGRMQQLSANLIITDPTTFHEICSADPAEPTTSTLVISDSPWLSASHSDLQEMVSKGLVGVLPNNSNSEQLKKAIKGVISGELWLDHRTIKNSFFVKGFGSDVKLTKKEIEVLRYLTHGHTNREIARRLFISEQTVKSHLNHLYKKFKVSNRVKLALCAKNMRTFDNGS